MVATTVSERAESDPGASPRKKKPAKASGGAKGKTPTKTRKEAPNKAAPKTPRTPPAKARRANSRTTKKPPKRQIVYLDDLEPVSSRIGFGDLGRHGSLGYQDRQDGVVLVSGERFDHALSTHPPARVLFPLRASFDRFLARVALTDDVPAGVSHADFTVLADGRPVAHEIGVAAGEGAREMVADIRNVRHLELKVETSRWPSCHAVWLEPRLEPSPDRPLVSTMTDCLNRVQISSSETLPGSERVIATVVSPGFEPQLDAMLSSLRTHGGCEDAMLAVFTVGESSEIDRLVSQHRATVIRCHAEKKLDPKVKSVLYSAARILDAEYFLCLDADLLVLGDLEPIFSALKALPSTSVLACREGNDRGWNDLNHMLSDSYGGQGSDVQRLLGADHGEGGYSLVVNDGVFGARRKALINLDRCIRDLPEAGIWIDEHAGVWWRNQFVFNLALARLDCGVELDPTFNIQLTSQEVDIDRDQRRARWQGQDVRILYFNGSGREKFLPYRDLLLKGA